MEQEVHKTINWMDKDELIQMIEDFGFAYDGDTEDEIREELRDIAMNDDYVQERILLEHS